MKIPGYILKRIILLSLILAFYSGQAARPIHSSRQVSDDEDQKPKLQEYGKLGFYFEPNYGQADARVKSLSRGSGYTLFLTSTDAVWSLSHNGKAAAVRMKTVGAEPEPFIEYVDRLPGISNYFIGNDPEKWRANIPHYSGVRYRDLYPGVDLVYHSKEGALEYDFVLTPGARSEMIKLAFEGAQDIRIDERGDLVLTTEAGELRQNKPVIYQEVEGAKKEVAGRFVQTGRREIGFEISDYDAGKPLVIDPRIDFLTYLRPSARFRFASVHYPRLFGQYLRGGTDQHPTTSP